MLGTTKQLLKNGWCNVNLQESAIKIAKELGGLNKRVIFITGRQKTQRILDLTQDSLNLEVFGYQSLNQIDLKTYIDVWIIDHPKQDATATVLRKLIGKHASIIYIID